MTNIPTTMNPADVHKAISQRGTRIATVSFVKKNGDVRIINGLFRPTSKIIGSDRGMEMGEAMRARGQVPIWSIADREWKSFFADRVVEIK
jgi:hypothetical protein